MAKKTIVRLYFPNIEREFKYEYDYDVNQERVGQALSTFYEQEADELFALYGYAPMDISVQADGEEVWQVKACYEEYMWHVFFAEGGEPWHGRIQQFVTSLISCRWRRDYNDEKVELLKAA